MRWCLLLASFRLGESSLFKGELGEIDVILWGGEQVDKLSHLRLEGGLLVSVAHSGKRELCEFEAEDHSPQGRAREGRRSMAPFGSASSGGGR
jgi:hypothetical protein